MYKAYAKAGSLLFYGLLFLSLGTVMIVTREYFLQTLTWVGGVVFLLLGVLDSISLFVQDMETLKRKSLGAKALSNLLLAFVLLLFEKWVSGIFPFLVGLIFCLYALVDFITFLTFHKNGVKGQIKLVVGAVLKLVVGVSFCLHPLYHMDFTTVYMGVVCIFIGLVYLQDFVSEVVPQKAKDKIKRRVHISLPVFLVAFIPKNTLDYINGHFETNRGEELEEFEGEKENAAPDMFVYIHVTEDGFGTIGHVDIGYGGLVYSYGNYDSSSYRLFESMGDGVLSISPKEKYIPFCIMYSKKTIFEFGLQLTDTQRREVEKALSDLKTRVCDWDPPLERFQKGVSTGGKQRDFDDYASCLYRATGGELYKFKSGRFKTYFVLSTNCVLLADSIIGHLGTNVVNLNGIISPGAYYDYFNRQYLLQNTSVVSKRVYAYEEMKKQLPAIGVE